MFYIEGHALLRKGYTQLYALPEHLDPKAAWHKSVHVPLTEAVRRDLTTWQALLQTQPRRMLYLRDPLHNGEWRQWGPKFDLKAHGWEESMMFVPGCTEDPIAVVHTDACTVGWGYVSGSERHHGAFSDSVRQKHINYKEAITVLFALRRFAGSVWYDCRVLVCSDNTTTVALVNAKCHLLPHLEEIAAEIRWICATHNLDVQAQHVATKCECRSALPPGSVVLYSRLASSSPHLQRHRRLVRATYG